jgi:hypothetical protein
LTQREQSSIYNSNLRLTQNRKDFVMKTKSDYYAAMNQHKNLVAEEYSFAPTINKSKKKTDLDTTGNRHDTILEKGKVY